MYRRRQLETERQSEVAESQLSSAPPSTTISDVGMDVDDVKEMSMTEKVEEKRLIAEKVEKRYLKAKGNPRMEGSMLRDFQLQSEKAKKLYNDLKAGR